MKTFLFELESIGLKVIKLLNLSGYKFSLAGFDGSFSHYFEKRVGRYRLMYDYSKEHAFMRELVDQGIMLTLSAVI